MADQRQAEEFLIRFRAQASPVPATVRLKRLLKTAGRVFGLTCMSVAPAPSTNPPAEPPAKSD